MLGGSRSGRSGWRRKLVIAAVIFALLPGCQWSPAQFYIPLAYGVAGLCIALLMSPTPAAAVVGFLVGGLLGAAVYNNSLKHQIIQRQKSDLSSAQPRRGSRAAGCQSPT